MFALVICGPALVILLFLAMGAGKDSPAAIQGSRLSAEQQAVVRAREDEFQAFAALARALKSQTKNPSSFQLAEAFLTQEGTACLMYRGTNSFNALVPGYAVFLPNGTAAAVGPLANVSATWNKLCAGKQSKDMMLVKHAI